MTAAAFTKGFLDLEGMLTPILASLVSKNKAATAMLDDTSDAGACPCRLHHLRHHHHLHLHLHLLHLHLH